MALASSDIRVELREVRLSDLPPQMLALSPKGTVPVLCLSDDRVIDESIDVMRWSLARSDPQGWLVSDADSEEWIRRNDEEFKPLLDRYKYADRYPEMSREAHRARAESFITELEGRLRSQPFLAPGRFGLVDAAILPFVRQFAGVEPKWFEQSDYPALRGWLEAVLASEFFDLVMRRYPFWVDGDAPMYF